MPMRDLHERLNVTKHLSWGHNPKDGRNFCQRNTQKAPIDGLEICWQDIKTRKRRPRQWNEICYYHAVHRDSTRKMLKHNNFRRITGNKIEDGKLSFLSILRYKTGHYCLRRKDRQDFITLSVLQTEEVMF